MEQNLCELKIRKVNERQFDVVLKTTDNVGTRFGQTYGEVNAFLWSLYGGMMYKCDCGRSVCSTISVKF